MCWKMDFLLFLSGVITTAIALRIYAKMKERQKYASEIIIFPDKSIACKDFFESIQGCCNNQCTFSHEVTGLSKLLSLIKSARKSIDICVFVISSQRLARAVIDRHKVGVRVRVVTDPSTEEASGSQMHWLMKDGIIVRVKRTPFLMHHKFVVIDDRIVAFGSFNWTPQAVTGNCESLAITAESWAVEPLKTEFLRLWTATETEQ